MSPEQLVTTPQQAEDMLSRAIAGQTGQGGSMGDRDLRAEWTAMELLNNKPLLEAYRAQQAQFYRDLVASNPAQFGGFLLGWLRRAAT